MLDSADVMIGAIFVCVQVFTASQEREAKRLNHFKEMLFGIHKCLDISENAE